MLPYLILAVTAALAAGRMAARANRRAEAAEQARRRFLTDMGHELRSPLNTILGFTRLMIQDPALPGPIREDLELVLKSSERLQAVIDHALDVAKAEVTGGHPPEGPRPAVEYVDSGRRVVGLAPGQPRYRILVVDDYFEARRLLVRLLSPVGFEVREAADGLEAIDLWRQWQPDLIWMDMRMPVLDGREATRRIRASQPGPQPVIIALSASSNEGKRSDVLAAGCDDFLRKPFPESLLFALIQKHLGVCFVYKDEAGQGAVPAAPDRAALAALPEVSRRELEGALRGLDAAAVGRAVDRIREFDPQLGDALAAWAGDFQYERILALLAGL